MRKDNPADHRNDERIVELTIAGSRFEAEALVAELKASGINAMIGSDDAGGWRPHMGFVEGYRVLVLEGDVPEAQRIIQPR